MSPSLRPVREIMGRLSKNRRFAPSAGGAGRSVPCAGVDGRYLQTAAEGRRSVLGRAGSG